MRKVVLLVCSFVHHFVMAQGDRDSLKLTLPEAEKIFLANNLSLLSAQYDVDISKALAMQARYWDNPQLITSQNLYDGKFFRHNTEDGVTYGQVYIQLQQIIRTAGKRNKLIRLAEDNALSAQQQLNNLLRNLKFILATDFNNLYQFLSINNIYREEIVAMRELSRGMDIQLQAGNISQKDDIRIKALLYTLQSDQADLLRQVVESERELHLLLRVGDSSVIVPLPFEGFEPEQYSFSLSQLLDTAMANRADMKLAQTNLLSRQHNLAYQKALVAPDLAVGVEYDQANSYVRNYWGLGLSLPLPLFDRNKGNIQAARLAAEQAASGIRLMQDQLHFEVQAAYNRWLIAKEMAKVSLTELGNRYDGLMQNMLNSYQHRQVSLIEFIDFFEAYKESRTRQFQQQANLLNAAAELNFTTGTAFVSFK